MLNPTRTLAFALWVIRQNKNLKALYKDYRKDTNDKNLDFLDFCKGMFQETVHMEGPDNEALMSNLIEIRVTVSNGMVESVFSNVAGELFDVDVLERDTRDPAFKIKVEQGIAEIEQKMHKIL